MDFTFLIKKMVSAMMMPFTIGVIFALIALWYIHKNRTQKAKFFLSLSLIWITLISYKPVAYYLLQPLEQSYPKLEKVADNIEYILLLGGNKKARTWEALRLYQQKPSLKLITSGCLGQAQAMKTLLIESGVPKESILMQPNPRDTIEEAQALKKRLGEQPFILITSAYHIPRAMEIFKKEGLTPTPAPTDIQIEKNDFVTSPKGQYLAYTERAWHEYIGLLWLKIRG